MEISRARPALPCKIRLSPSREGLPERWPSGLRRTLGKRVCGKPYRGFESHSLRHRAIWHAKLRFRALNGGGTPPLQALCASAVGLRFSERISRTFTCLGKQLALSYMRNPPCTTTFRGIVMVRAAISNVPTRRRVGSGTNFGVSAAAKTVSWRRPDTLRSLGRQPLVAKLCSLAAIASSAAEAGFIPDPDVSPSCPRSTLQ